MKTVNEFVPFEHQVDGGPVTFLFQKNMTANDQIIFAKRQG